MTDDPVKLYVVVMAILLCVLGYVAYTSYQEAAAYEKALEAAPKNAKKLRDAAAEVQALCDQLSQARLTKGHRTLIEEAERDSGVKHSSLKPQTPKRMGRGVREVRWKVEFRNSRGSRALRRSEVAKFCQAVERYSQNILKTIEITLNRVTGAKIPGAGKQEVVDNDIYSGSVVFGLRTLDN